MIWSSLGRSTLSQSLYANRKSYQIENSNEYSKLFNVQLLTLSALSEVSVEEDEERLHLGFESLAKLKTFRISFEEMRAGREKKTHLFVFGIIDLLNHGVELVTHSLGGNTGSGSLEVLSFVHRVRRARNVSFHFPSNKTAQLVSDRVPLHAEVSLKERIV